MLTTIISMVCALSLGASSVSSQADTVNVYMINDEKVANFDGSQLVGKTITDYKVVTATKDNTVYQVHGITTGDAAAQAKKAENTVYIIDGKKSSEAAMNSLQPDTISAITIYKAGSKEAAKWTKDQNQRVIVIDIKK